MLVWTSKHVLIRHIMDLWSTYNLNKRCCFLFLTQNISWWPKIESYADLSLDLGVCLKSLRVVVRIKPREFVQINLIIVVKIKLSKEHPWWHKPIIITGVVNYSVKSCAQFSFDLTHVNFNKFYNQSKHQEANPTSFWKSIRWRISCKLSYHVFPIKLTTPTSLDLPTNQL